MGLGHGAGDRFVELVILILLNVIRLPGPDGLGRVAQLPIPGCLLNLLCLGFLLFLIFLRNSSFLISTSAWRLLVLSINLFSIFKFAMGSIIDKISLATEENVCC